MSLIKLILIAIAIVLGVILAFSAIGIIYSALWYLFLIGIVAAAGIVGYKLLKKNNVPELENKQPISIKELDNANRTLEEYKRKYLPK